MQEQVNKKLIASAENIFKEIKMALTIDEMKRNESKMFYDMYPRMGLCQDYSLDGITKKELFEGVSELDIRNNTKFVQAPCWHVEGIKFNEEITAEQITFAARMTMAQMQCDSIEMDEESLNSLKAKYYGNSIKK